jgi:hypothetical protein
MMVPALAACRLRLRRIEGTSRPLSLPFLEGLLWGCGCWIKPHLLIIAAVMWVYSTSRLGPRRDVLKDFVAVFSGGLLVGILGLGCLKWTGTWPYFLDVWQNWNSSYFELVIQELPYRVTSEFLTFFPPYSIFVVVAIPLAVLNLRVQSTEPQAVRRSFLAMLYLCWVLTTLFLQRGFPYVHIPETLLMLAFFATNRCPVPSLTVLIQAVVGVILVLTPVTSIDDFHRTALRENWLYQSLFQPSDVFRKQRTDRWPECFQREVSRKVRRDLALCPNHMGGIDPVELGAVADWLRAQTPPVGDRELIAWHDTPHALYLDLGIKPGLRFMHVSTAWSIVESRTNWPPGTGPDARILAELQAAMPHARFVVSDMHRLTRKYRRLNELGPDGLPVVLPPDQRKEFPFTLPIEYRSPSGRYIVHRAVGPVTSCNIPRKID